MDTALTIGGTRFIGRHTVLELLDHGYEVTTFTRGEHDNPFAGCERVSQFSGDRHDRAALEAARDAVDPDAVFDFVGLFPDQVEEATSVFADAEAYVFVSSANAYEGPPERPFPSPLREDGTPLQECTDEQATDESDESYGARKAECDRVCFRAAEAGVDAMVVRPVLVYGPHDYTERHDYWLHRVATHDRILVPGDGDSLLHRVFVEDLARALRIVAERGDPGEAYNAADRQLTWLDRTIELGANALEADVELVHASPRELGRVDLAPMDFPLYSPTPLVAETEKLAALGWDSTPPAVAMERTVAEHLDADRTGEALAERGQGVDRETERALIEDLSTE
jgi:nucleoside-diphosphate-sugar epimerase